MATQRYNLDTGNENTLNIRVDQDVNDDHEMQYTVTSPDIPGCEPTTSTTSAEDALDQFVAEHEEHINKATTPFPDNPSGDAWSANTPSE